MAEFTLAGKVVLDDKGAQQPLKSLKAQLKEATLELQNVVAEFGMMSDQAAAAARRVAELKDEIGDANALAEAFSPEAKFNAFAGAITGVAGGISAVQGAMALFGDKSEAVAQTLAKVQGALALSQGLNSVFESIDAFKNLGAVLQQNVLVQRVLNYVMQGQFKTNAQLVGAKQADVTATTSQTVAQTTLATATTASSVAMKVLRGAIISTGIGALIVGVGMLISAIGDWIDSSDENKEAQERVNDALDKQNKLYEQQQSLLDYNRQVAVKQAEIAGKSAEDIYKINAEYNKKAITQAQSDTDRKLELYYEYVSTLEDFEKTAHGATYRGTQEQLDQAHKLFAEYEKGLQNVTEATRKANLDDLDNQKRVADEKRKAQEEAKKKADDLAKKQADEAQRRHEKAVEDAKKRAQEIADATRQSEANARKLREESYLLSIEDERKREDAKLQIDFENERKKINSTKATEEAKQKELQALDDKFTAERKKNQAERDKEEQENIKAFQTELNDIITQTKLNGIKDEYERSRAEVSVNYDKQRADIDANEKLNADQKLELKKALAIREQQELDKLETDHKNAVGLKKLESDIAELDALMNKETTYLSVRKNTLDQEQALLDQAKANGILTEEEYTTKNDELTQKRIAIGELEKQAKEAQLAGIGNALSNLSSIVGQETAVGKALSVASTAISTYTAAQKAYQSAFMPVPTPASPALGAVFAGIAVAQGLVNIRKILATKVPKSGGKDSTSAPSVSAVTPPLPPTAGGTMINQGQVNQLVTANASARAYVVESDVTGSQERIERLNRASRIN